jgi:hypothetical protein
MRVARVAEAVRGDRDGPAVGVTDAELGDPGVQSLNERPVGVGISAVGIHALARK